MKLYKQASAALWTGRNSGQKLYLHEKIGFLDLVKERKPPLDKGIALLGYACDAGVKRNKGRVGAAKGPEAVKRVLAKLPNHLRENKLLLDAGTVVCSGDEMEEAQQVLADKVSQLLSMRLLPILIGGGHDMAYGHYHGIKGHLKNSKTIGIINFDAHFDLRSNENGNNSGTPFYQIAGECRQEGTPFHYLCIGIREDANDKLLFSTAEKFGVGVIPRSQFNLQQLASVKKAITKFASSVDVLYLTIDLDGFSSAFAPGVSAPSPLGFTPDIVLESLQCILDTKKLYAVDVAELNPTYDIDQQTARLAAGLLHYILHRITLL